MVLPSPIKMKRVSICMILFLPDRAYTLHSSIVKVKSSIKKINSDQ